MNASCWPADPEKKVAAGQSVSVAAAWACACEACGGASPCQSGLILRPSWTLTKVSKWRHNLSQRPLVRQVYLVIMTDGPLRRTRPLRKAPRTNVPASGWPPVHHVGRFSSIGSCIISLRAASTIQDAHGAIADAAACLALFVALQRCSQCDASQYRAKRKRHIA